MLRKEMRKRRCKKCREETSHKRGKKWKEVNDEIGAGNSKKKRRISF